MDMGLKINVRGTLCSMQVGDVCHLPIEQVKGSTLRHTASILREQGLQYTINKRCAEYIVQRIA